MAQPMNLLTNPTFIGLEAETHSDWILLDNTEPGDYMTIVYPDDPENRALLIFDSQPDSATGVGLYQRVKVEPGRKYRFSVLAKALPEGSSDGVGLQIRFYPSGERHVLNVNATNPHEFEEFAVEAVAPEGSTHARFYIWTSAKNGGKILVRSAMLEQVAPAQADVNLLTNPRFSGAEELIPPAGWTLLGTTEHGDRITVVSPHDPHNRALHFVDAQAPSEIGIGLYQSLPIEEGLYKLTAYVKASPEGSSQGVRLQLRYYPSGQRHEATLWTTNTDTFEEHSVWAITPPGTTSARVYVYTQAPVGGQILVREVILEKVVTAEQDEEQKISWTIDRSQGYAVHKVHDIQQLQAAMRQAAPGDVIEMADGVWRDVQILFDATATEDKPITLRAQTPGQVILTGMSTLVFSAPYLIASGLYFKRDEPVESLDNVVTFASHHCRLVESAIENYNPPEFSAAYKWVYFLGSHNTVERSFFAGKTNMGQVIAQDDFAIHNTVRQNHFKNIPYDPTNGREVIQATSAARFDRFGKESGSGASYMLIEGNLFEQAHGEGSEIISLKSSHNIVRDNTFIETMGSIVARVGDYNTIERNIIIGGNLPRTGGVRISGIGHRVVGNYISGVELGGLILQSGEYVWDEQGAIADLTGSFEPQVVRGDYATRYAQVLDCLFADNVLVNNCGPDIWIGYWYKHYWPELQLVLLPEKNRFENNTIIRPNDNFLEVMSQDTTPPLQQFSFAPNHFMNNIVYGSIAGNSVMPEGFILQDYAYAQTEDGVRRLDDERFAVYGQPPLRRLTSADVGPSWYTFPTVTITVDQEDSVLSEQRRVNVDANGTNIDPVKSVTVTMNGIELYKGDTAPDTLTIDTPLFVDRNYHITAAATTHNGVQTTCTLSFKTADWFTDGLMGPVNLFGTLINADLFKEKSPGWRYATGDAANFHDDNDRLVRSADTTEYLVWESTDVHRFEIAVYAKKLPLTDRTLVMSVSEDGKNWRDVTYRTDVFDSSATDFTRILVRGTVPTDIKASFVRLTIHAGTFDGEDLQLGYVKFATARENEDTLQVICH
jgi:poly(beta-D-mannuronate) lyase